MIALPDFPWDSLVPFAERARAHPDGMIDLSVGSPVDATPALIREAAADATDAHAYPLTAGTAALRSAIVAWFARRRGVEALQPDAVLPTIGSKEFVAQLPLWLGLGSGDTVVHPLVAYPTYAIGAALTGSLVHAGDDPREWPESTKLVWVNSPGNPDGRVLSVDELRGAVERARELGAVIVSDECYAELGWSERWRGAATPSILDPDVVGDDHTSVLAVYSLSKQSNLAGYRAGFVAGDPAVVDGLLGIRKHLGLIPPAPVQRAMIAALGDDGHVSAQRELYRTRRARLERAVVAAGFRIDGSEAGLYLWATQGEDAAASVSRLAELGILTAPGSFYGDAGREHIRIALTATDDDIARAAERLDASTN
ncbi:succinyldiaminopimelate transaminase [Marisediminicola sp. LYQ85]|uniref:succinyldiaminopimelate transaminase n=1 Tax=Marisediminicola sp. LYQ85 TaxID=3391062 RepID=UPI003983B70A